MRHEEKDPRAVSFQANGAEGETAPQGVSIENRHGEHINVRISTITELLRLLGDLQRRAEARADEIIAEQQQQKSEHSAANGGEA